MLERQFAAENPVQISPDSQNRDCKQHETDPMQTLITLCSRQMPDFPRPLSTLGESGVQVQEKGQI